MGCGLKLTMLETIIIILVINAISTNAEPECSTIQVYDQSGRAVPSLEVKAVGGSVQPINYSHYMVCGSGDGFLLRVYLYNVTVYQGYLRLGKNYIVKAGVVDMQIEAPSELKITVCLVGSIKCWSLFGYNSYVIRQVPVGTYKITVQGLFRTEKTVYFNGGTISVTEERGLAGVLTILIPLLVTAMAAAIAGKRDGIFESWRKTTSVKKREKPRTVNTPASVDEKSETPNQRLRYSLRGKTLAEILEETP